jgi:hypothetical protein
MMIEYRFVIKTKSKKMNKFFVYDLQELKRVSPYFDTKQEAIDLIEQLIKEIIENV